MGQWAYQIALLTKLPQAICLALMVLCSHCLQGVSVQQVPAGVANGCAQILCQRCHYCAYMQLLTFHLGVSSPLCCPGSTHIAPRPAVHRALRADGALAVHVGLHIHAISRAQPALLHHPGLQRHRIHVRPFLCWLMPCQRPATVHGACNTLPLLTLHLHGMPHNCVHAGSQKFLMCWECGLMNVTRVLSNRGRVLCLSSIAAKQDRQGVACCLLWYQSWWPQCGEQPCEVLHKHRTMLVQHQGPSTCAANTL